MNNGRKNPEGLRRRFPEPAKPRDSEDRPHPPIPTAMERARKQVGRTIDSGAASVRRSIAPITAPLTAMATATPLRREMLHAATHSDDSLAANSSRASLATHLAHRIVGHGLPALPDPVHIVRRTKEAVGHLSDTVGHLSKGHTSLAVESATRTALSTLDASTGTGLMPFGVGEVTHVGIKLAEARLRTLTKKAIGKFD